VTLKNNASRHSGRTRCPNRGSYFGSHMSPHVKGREISEATYQESEALTIVPAAERAHFRLLECVAVLMEADDHIDPNIGSIGSLGNVQDPQCIEPLGEQEYLVRGARKREFGPAPQFEWMVMLFVGLILGPISGIHTGIDIVFGVIMMWAVRVSIVHAELSVRTLREESGATSAGSCQRKRSYFGLYTDPVMMTEPPSFTVTEEEASCEPYEERSDKEMAEAAAPTATAPVLLGLSMWWWWGNPRRCS
jgi:hypothetical protein